MTDLLESKKVKTRKPHICQGCGRQLQKGDTAQVDKLADGGEIWRFYHCDDCWEWWQKECNGCDELKAGFCIAEHYPVGAIAECRREKGAV